MEKSITINIHKLADEIVIFGDLTDIQKVNLKKEVEKIILDAIKNAESNLIEVQENP